MKKFEALFWPAVGLVAVSFVGFVYTAVSQHRAEQVAAQQPVAVPADAPPATQ